MLRKMVEVEYSRRFYNGNNVNHCICISFYLKVYEKVNNRLERKINRRGYGGNPSG